jgi:glutamate-5-semialdehyde dehydrogenase
MKQMQDLLSDARDSARALSRSGGASRNAALEAIARALDESRASILAANAEDLAAARRAGISEALVDRLGIDRGRFQGIIDSVREVIALSDPLSEMRELGERPNGLRVLKRRVPLGVLAVIYESRPNVTVEAASLAIKSGNAVILRGGREALRSNAALVSAIRSGIERANLPANVVQFIEDPSRDRVVELLGSKGRIDLAIARGGSELMAMVDACAKVPVMRHGQGITHLFVDKSADAQMAQRIALNAKTQRPGVCNALETLLVHQATVDTGAWEEIAKALVGGGVELRVDPEAGKALRRADIPWVAATSPDWDTEFLSLTLAVRTVASLDDALAHIAAHGTQHTASIVTSDRANAERFLREVDASCVLWNASTRFNDGGELGLGSEMGISTSKMHAFGPMGLRELTAEKFVVYGTGQVRS